jgi:hypothetical protein
MSDLTRAAQRLLEAWDTTPLFKAGNGMLQEYFEVLRDATAASLITLPRATVQQALEALEKTHTQPGCEQWQAERRASVALRAALERPEQAKPVEETVAWRYQAQGRWLYVDKNPNLWQDKPDGEIQSLHAKKTTDFCSESKNGAILTVEPDSASN